MPRPSTVIGQDLNRTQAARFFGIAMPTIDQWRDKGCPHRKQGAAVIFNSKDVVAWLQDRARAEAGKGKSDDGETIESLRLRRERAETESAERKNEAESGRVVDISTAEGTVAEIVAMLSSQHEALPARFGMPIAYKVAALLPEAKAELVEEIRSAVEAGLKECSDEMRNAIATGEGLPDLFDGDSESSPVAA